MDEKEFENRVFDLFPEEVEGISYHYAEPTVVVRNTASVSKVREAIGMLYPRLVFKVEAWYKMLAAIPDSFFDQPFPSPGVGAEPV